MNYFFDNKSHYKCVDVELFIANITANELSVGNFLLLAFQVDVAEKQMLYHINRLVYRLMADLVGGIV